MEEKIKAADSKESKIPTLTIRVSKTNTLWSGRYRWGSFTCIRVKNGRLCAPRIVWQMLLGRLQGHVQDIFHRWHRCGPQIVQIIHKRHLAKNLSNQVFFLRPFGIYDFLCTEFGRLIQSDFCAKNRASIKL
jgi:hypothetical protein